MSSCRLLRRMSSVVVVMVLLACVAVLDGFSSSEIEKIL